MNFHLYHLSSDLFFSALTIGSEELQTELWSYIIKKIIINNLFLTRDNLEKILRSLQETCEAIFLLAPRRYGFRPGALWEYEKKN